MKDAKDSKEITEGQDSDDSNVVDVVKQLTNTDANSVSKVYQAQGLKCDFCALRPIAEEEAARCSTYKKGNDCLFKPIQLEHHDDILDMINKTLSIAFDRFFRAALIEKMDGGVLDKAVSDEMRRLLEMIEAYKRILSKPVDKISIEATGTGGTGALGSLLKDLLKD